MKKLAHTLENDLEAFARRSAIWTLGHLSPLVKESSQSEILSSEILRLIEMAAHDFDWEVKKGVVDICVSALTKIPISVDSDPKKKLESKHSRYLKVLLDLSQDCDRSVQLKTCIALQTLRSRIILQKQHQQQDNGGPLSPNKKLKTENPTEIPCHECSSDKPLHQFCSHTAVEHLLQMDIDNILLTAFSSTDRHVGDPLAMFQDILADCQDTMQDYQGEEFEDNAVDCY